MKEHTVGLQNMFQSKLDNDVQPEINTKGDFVSWAIWMSRQLNNKYPSFRRHQKEHLKKYIFLKYPSNNYPMPHHL